MQTPRRKCRISGRIPAVLAAVSITTAVLAGCGPAKHAAKPLPDAATLLKECSQTTKGVTSVHLVLSVTGKVKGLPVKTLTGDLTTTPSTAAKGDATITLAGNDVDAQFVVYNTVLYAALTPNKWSDFGPAADIYDPASILNPNTGLANMLVHFIDPTAQGRANLNGQDTVRISGKVSADAVNALAPQLNATQPLPATVWIQENGSHELVQATMDQSPGNSIQMTLSNWGEPVQVTKPPVS
ncbi:LppX_LprAFG lipoprotein [Mycobacterium sp. SM1]|uniref:LppX_LprAFG lipoprotein n=1 Tax=Mycobacterium sp. SM1 TaxID=2816243 RepID=UPI001BCC46FE|nr:LppX_LprAFG lipoprotein [Mycobacterium sp. SM1]MBS4729438.1 LppX_LprAFG lipoprotein [Mycobacterium sp. SM1]